MSKSVKHDDGKTKYHLVKPEMIEEVAKVMTFGAKKYAEDNWINLPDAENRYYSAMMRHMADHRRGELYDPESGLRHISHALTCLNFLTYLQCTKKNTSNSGEKSLRKVKSSRPVTEKLNNSLGKA